MSGVLFNEDQKAHIYQETRVKDVGLCLQFFIITLHSIMNII